MLLWNYDSPLIQEELHSSNDTSEYVIPVLSVRVYRKAGLIVAPVSA